MKKIYFSALIIILLLTAFVFKTPLVKGAESLVYYSPCDAPIGYTIGTIDSGFNTTRDELLKDSKIAANVWNSSINKTLLKYDPKSDFTINLVYDTRQELTSKITDLRKDLDEKQNEIDPKIEDYKRRQLEFQENVKKLNDDISYWNSQGGAPKEEYEKLVQRQEELKNQAEALNQEAESLGQQTDEYNSNARHLNSTIDDYQGVLVTHPEEGLYEQDGSKRKISIYIDVSHEEFLHTLTHEFGHALGLDHNSNSKSIMYPQTSKVLTPSKEEIEELSNICKRRTTIEVVYNRMTEIAELIRARVTKAN